MFGVGTLLSRVALPVEGLPNPAVDACAACCDGRTLSEPNRARAPICLTHNFRMHATRKLPVVPICRMGSCLRRRANRNDLLAHPASMKRDVRAIVTTREAGMRWTRMARKTNVACADSEVAWSWPPDAEALRSRDDLADDGGKKAGHKSAI
jgi:hypothetical protein